MILDSRKGVKLLVRAKDSKNQDEIQEKPEVKKSERLTSFIEFSLGKRLTPMQSAGFETYIRTKKYKMYQTDADWDKLLKEYQNRKL